MRKKRLKVLLAGTLTLLVIIYHAELPSLTREETVFLPTESYEAEALPQLPSSTPLETQETILQAPEQEERAAEIPVTSWPKLSDGFIYLKEALPDAQFDVRYATSHNFTGQVVEGYGSDHIFCTLEAAEALKKVNTLVSEKGYGLLIYDAYRPKRAVDFFIQWGDTPEDNKTKEEFYPDFDKKDLFKLGYLAKRSAHSRGSTIDLTLYARDTGEPLDMGSPYDFLGPISNHDTELITEEQIRNRNILREAMKASGFKELRTEWWHYQLINEPFPQTFFDFPIQ